MTTCHPLTMLFLAGSLASVQEWRFDVAGTVIDSAGHPAINATVVLIDNQSGPSVDWEMPEGDPKAFVTRTDEFGAFVFPQVRAASYWLFSRDHAGAAHVRRIGFHDEPPPPFQVQLSHTVLEGTVLWPDGTPVTDARVGLDYDIFITRTDRTGSFRFPGIPAGEYTVGATATLALTAEDWKAIDERVAATGHGPRARPTVARPFEEVSVETKVRIEGDQTSQVEMILPGNVVEGVVKTPEGEPVAGACVGGGRRATFTDQAGRFELTHVPSGRCGIYVQGRSVTVDVDPGEQPSWVQITVYSFRPEVIFHFKDAEGRPLKHQTMRRISGRPPNHFGGVETDDEGRWKEVWMDSKTDHYLFGSPTLGYAEQTVVVAEGVRETHCEVTLALGATVCGTVREQGNRQPMGGVALMPIRVAAGVDYDQMSPWNGLYAGHHNRLVSGYPVTQVTRDGDGTYCLKNLPPGEYRLLAIGTDAEARVSIKGPEVITLDLDVPAMPEKRWVSGRVLGPGGEPVAKAEVMFITDFGGPSDWHFYGPLNGVPRRVLTDDEGRFRLGPLPPREWWFTAESPGHKGEMTKLDLSKDSVEGVEFQIRDAEGPVEAP